MPEIDISCSICGEDLEAAVDGGVLFVDPCERCMDEAKQAAHSEGYTVGRHAGHEAGIQAERARQEYR